MPTSVSVASMAVVTSRAESAPEPVFDPAFEMIIAPVALPRKIAVSMPAPPSTLSLSAPPSMVSLLAAPTSVSRPARPRTTRGALMSVAATMSSAEVPRMSTVPAPETRTVCWAALIESVLVAAMDPSSCSPAVAS